MTNIKYVFVCHLCCKPKNIRGQIQCSFRLQNKNLIVMFFNENQKSKTNKKLFHDFIIQVPSKKQCKTFFERELIFCCFANSILTFLLHYNYFRKVQFITDSRSLVWEEELSQLSLIDSFNEYSSISETPLLLLKTEKDSLRRISCLKRLTRMHISKTVKIERTNQPLSLR